MGRIKQMIKEKCPNLASRIQKIRSEKRRKSILYGISKEQLGLEFGPSYNPIAPKKLGYHVEIVDWLDQEGLRKQYGIHNVDVDAIEEVDYVGSGDYYDLIQKDTYYDYIIASHVIEHTTNLLKFLQDCSRMLKIGGYLFLAIPDKRYEFDILRNVTDLDRVMDDYYSDSMTHPPGLIVEYLNNVVKRNDKISWSKSVFPWNRLHGIEFVHDQSYIEGRIKAVIRDGAYEDIHHYVFTPNSFKLLIYDLRTMGLLDLEIIRMRGSKLHEFIVVLRRTKEHAIRNDHYRMKLMKKRNQ